MTIAHKKNFLFFALMIALVILCIFVIGEIVFRIARPAKATISLGKPHPVFHHLYPSNYKGSESYAGFKTTFSLNSDGFRGGEYPVRKPKGLYRIAVLGDSFTFGTAVNDNETFSYLLQDNLNTKIGGKRYEVMNFGIASYSPILEYLLLKYKVIKYSPDMVILFYDFSDLQDDALYVKKALYDESGDLIACNPRYINGHLDYLQLLKKHCRFFSYTHNKLSDIFRKIRMLGLKDYARCVLRRERVKLAIRERPDLKNAEFDRYFIFRENKDKGVIQFYWKNSAWWLDKIKHFLDERGVEFILVAYPYGIQVSPHAWQDGRLSWGFQKDKLYDCAVPFEMFYDYAKEKKVKFINLWPHLLKYNTQNLYYDWDGHWTSLGHEIVAEGIVNNPVFIETIKQ